MFVRSTMAFAICACCCFFPGALQADDDAVEVFRRVEGSVVRLESPDAYGTGMIVQPDGLILTNAHVIMSPLKFRCIAQVQGSEQTETVAFEQVEIVGFHPQLDMALVRINLAEHPGELRPVTFCGATATTGQQIFTIGNPGRELSNSISQGILSGVDRQVEGASYYQLDAPINPGNSGGPLCNSAGEVIGMVTFKMSDAESIGFAIPLQGIEPESFVPLAERDTNPPQALHLQLLGNEWYEKARAVAHDHGELNEEDAECYHQALACYQLAILHDPTNDALYQNVGTLLRTLERYETAIPYFIEAIRLDPWAEDWYHYRELGLSLVKLGKWEEAVIVWQEGIAKFPNAAAKIWEDLAITHGLLGEAYAASYSAGVVEQLGHMDSRMEVMHYIYGLNFEALSEEEQTRLTEQLENVLNTLDRRAQYAASQQEDGVLWMTNEFENFMQERE